ncbi:MAG TPA: MmgE/PrpD family protein [Ktedonobacteraceae bacterium]|nr:MmgE/PrpD family protein [Ktedonobacteraceae bacterium]
MMTTDQTAELAQFCATLKAENLPEVVRDRVYYLLLDHLAVTLRGSILPSSQAAYRLLQSIPGAALPQGSTIFGRAERAEASWAALLNGVASHGLEMDDVENRSSLHPGVVVFPAALALAEQLNSSVERFYAAVVAGYEVTLRVGAALNPASAYDRGFHPTAVCGTFGATAVSAYLLGLSPEQTALAFGIAGSMASGSMAYLHDGAWTKRLHPGWSSHAGITAARLALAGFVGPTDVLESRYGFLHAYSSESDSSQLKGGADFAIMDVSLKPYACCRYMHGPIDCLLQIRERHYPEPEQIATIRCGVLTGGRGLIADPIEQKRQAKTIVDAQFSMPFGAAIALLTGQAGMTVFTEQWLHDPAVRSLMQRVACYASPELDRYYPAEWRAAACVQMTDGREFQATIRYPLGDPHNPLSWQQLEARFHELVAPIIAEQHKREKIIKNVRMLENLRSLVDVS